MVIGYKNENDPIPHPRISLELRESKALTELMSLQPCPGEEGDLFTKLSLSLYLSCNSLNQNAEVKNNQNSYTWNIFHDFTISKIPLPGEW